MLLRISDKSTYFSVLDSDKPVQYALRFSEREAMEEVTEEYVACHVVVRFLRLINKSYYRYRLN